MTKLHFVKKARKDYKKYGIKKGEPYWFWKFARRPKQYSRVKPRPSRLTRSEFLQAWLRCQESLEDESGGSVALADACRDVADQIEDLGKDCGSKLEAIRDRFPNGCPTMELMEQRKEACERVAREIRDAADSDDIADLTNTIDWSVE